MARNTIGFFNQLRTRANVVLGEGTDVQRIENTVILDFNDFSRGLNVSVPADRVPDGFVSAVRDFSINEQSQLVRVPGVVLEESFAAAARVPKELFVLGNPATGLAELVFIDGAFLGIRGPLGGATVWTNAGLPAGFEWATCVHGDELILTNGAGSTFKKQPLATAVIALGHGPARAVMSFAGRVFSGGAVDGGTYIPMGITWTGSSSLPNDLGPGSGFEELLDDTSNGDMIVAMRSLNFDTAAILTRNAVWLARRTGDANRPADFAPVVGGFGALTNATVVRVPGGIAYLSQRDVIVFDGNTPQSISLQINSALFPINTSKLAEYSLNYVESRHVLQVATPIALYEYSFTYQRWLCNSLQVRRIVNLGTDFVSMSGTMLGSSSNVGGWGNSWGLAWGIKRPGGGGGDGSTARTLDTTIFLQANRIGRESVAASTFFGIPIVPVVDTQLQQAQSLDTVTGIKRFIIQYSGEGGLVQISVPNYSGDWQVVRTVLLPAATTPRTRSFISRVTGTLLGLRVSLLSGSVAIGRLQAEVEMRSVDRQGGGR